MSLITYSKMFRRTKKPAAEAGFGTSRLEAIDRPELCIAVSVAF